MHLRGGYFLPAGNLAVHRRTDVLWRTVATCAAFATGMVAFFVVNAVFDWPGDGPPHV